MWCAPTFETDLVDCDNFVCWFADLIPEYISVAGDGWMGLTNQVEWETLNKLRDEFNIYDKSFQTLNISKV